jgi:hypothetical protein
MRQFNNVEKDLRKRKQVFNEFVAKTKYIAPLIKKRFEQTDNIYLKYSKKKLDPLEGYLENENISYSQLINFVKSMGQCTKKPF